jgi:hypothetical protein
MIVRVVYREPFDRIIDHDETEDGKVHCYDKTRLREEYIECHTWGMSGAALAFQRDVNDNGEEEGRLMLADNKTWFIFSAMTAEEVLLQEDGSYKGVVSGKVYKA